MPASSRRPGDRAASRRNLSSRTVTDAVDGMPQAFLDRYPMGDSKTRAPRILCRRSMVDSRRRARSWVFMDGVHSLPSHIIPPPIVHPTLC